MQLRPPLIVGTSTLHSLGVVSSDGCKDNVAAQFDARREAGVTYHVATRAGVGAPLDPDASGVSRQLLPRGADYFISGGVSACSGKSKP
jgi:hypothetical protein